MRKKKFEVRTPMHKAYYSSMLNCPADRVWALIRDFNNYPRYIESVVDSVIEDGKRGDEVGAVRRFSIGGVWRRQRLASHSDAERSFTYAGMEPLPFPREGSNAPAPVNYQGTVRLAPIVDGGRTFVEWFVEFDGPSNEAPQWTDLLLELIAQWVDSLGRTLAGQR
jgi:polyketide cyclase/dehydrase/lipid transport protein